MAWGLKMSNITFRAVVGLITLALSGNAAAQVACEKCDKVIVLDQARWTCLLDRVDGFSKQTSPTVFFTLNERSCPASRQVVVPKGVPATKSKTVYQLSQKQIQCLKKIQRTVKGPDYRVDFTTMCGR